MEDSHQSSLRPLLKSYRQHSFQLREHSMLIKHRQLTRRTIKQRLSQWQTTWTATPIRFLSQGFKFKLDITHLTESNPRESMLNDQLVRLVEWFTSHIELLCTGILIGSASGFVRHAIFTILLIANNVLRGVLHRQLLIGLMSALISILQHRSGILVRRLWL